MCGRERMWLDLSAAETRMWELVVLYTGRVGYHRGTKAAGLDASPPVINCSGWVGLLLSSAMKAQNADAGKGIFDNADIIEARTSTPLVGSDITAATLPKNATIGLNIGDFGWEINFPRTRGINHIVQVVRRPTDQIPFVSESIGQENKGGVRLTPLAARRLAPRLRPLYRSRQSMGGRPFRHGQLPEPSIRLTISSAAAFAVCWVGLALLGF
jgi:hypothetical protein